MRAVQFVPPAFFLVGYNVLFGSIGSASERASNSFKDIFPSIGTGLRIKFNKFSNTNLCIDYGTGIKGSDGFGGNLGEVF